jgi:hypothetical protein
MPGYGGAGQAQVINDNQQVFLFRQETNVTGSASIALQPKRTGGYYYPLGMSLQLYFTNASGSPSDPGAFEVDIQTSDVDQDAQYCTAASWTGDTNLNSSFVGRIELPNLYAKYVRAYVKTLTNAVYTTLLATH